jgi:hypothetical protein
MALQPVRHLRLRYYPPLWDAVFSSPPRMTTAYLTERMAAVMCRTANAPRPPFG